MAENVVNGSIASRRRFLLYCLVLVFINVFVFNFISQERYIYSWDYSLYWEKYQKLGDNLISEPAKAFSSVWHSIRHRDYNLMPVFFLMPFRLLFGTSRLSYILAIANIYVFSAAVVCSVLIAKIAAPAGQKESFPVAAMGLLMFILLPQVWIPVLLGYPDVVGVVIIFIILYQLLKAPLDELRFIGLVRLGTLLCLLVLLRRWYAYWVVSFFIAYGLERSVTLYFQYRFDLKKYIPALQKGIFVGMVSAAIFLIIAGPQARKMISTNYADIYSAYKYAGSIWEVVSSFSSYIGPVLTILFIAGLLSGMATTNKRPFFIFLTLQFATSILLFTRIQDFGTHHYYLLVPTVTISVSLCLSNFLRWIKNISSRFVIVFASAVFMTIQFLAVFVPGVVAKSPVAGLFVSSYRHYPLVRNDLADMRRLLEVLLKRADGGVYVVASSYVLNDDILRNACRVFDYPANFCKRIYRASHVDKRDGFPKDFLSATRIIVADPIQYHLRPMDQRVVGVLADVLTEGSGIGVAFERLPDDFILDKAVHVRIYQKKRQFSDVDLHDLEERFVMYYPNRKDIFAINPPQP